MPILIFGSENWILSDSLMYKLEIYLGELSKRALKWPKHLQYLCCPNLGHGIHTLQNPVPEAKLPEETLRRKSNRCGSSSNEISV